MEFVYYGHANRKALGKCACDVTGGPTYTVDLVGEASNVGFRQENSHFCVSKRLKRLARSTVGAITFCLLTFSARTPDSLALVQRGFAGLLQVASSPRIIAVLVSILPLRPRPQHRHASLCLPTDHDMSVTAFAESAIVSTEQTYPFRTKTNISPCCGIAWNENL